MSYTLKTTGIPAGRTVKFCLVVNEAGDAIIDLVTGNTISVGAGVQIVAGSWNGTDRKYIQTVGSDYNPIGVTWSGALPTFSPTPGLTIFAAVDGVKGIGGTNPASLFTFAERSQPVMVAAAGLASINRMVGPALTANIPTPGDVKASHIFKAVGQGAGSIRQGLHGSALATVASGTDTSPDFINLRSVNFVGGAPGESVAAVGYYCFAGFDGPTSDAEDTALHTDWFAEMVAAPAGGGAATPGAPTGLTAGTATATTQHLTWTAPTTGTPPFAYSIGYRLNSAGGSYTIAATGVSGTAFTVTGLSPSTAYDYFVSTSGSALGTAATLGNVSTAAPSSTSTVTLNLRDRLNVAIANLPAMKCYGLMPPASGQPLPAGLNYAGATPNPTTGVVSFSVPVAAGTNVLALVTNSDWTPGQSPPAYIRIIPVVTV